LTNTVIASNYEHNSSSGIPGVVVGGVYPMGGSSAVPTVLKDQVKLVPGCPNSFDYGTYDNNERPNPDSDDW
jgi:hypothetical protein